MRRLLFILFPLSSHAAIITATVDVPGYATCNMIVYVPDSAQGKLPVFVFIPGSGESSTNSDQLYTYGPLGFVRNGWKPNEVIVGIQPIAPWAGASFVSAMLGAILSNPDYHADPCKITLSGLSSGCYSVFNYVHDLAGYTIPVAAIVPMSYVEDASCGTSLCGVDLRYANIGVWGFCGTQDAFYGQESTFINLLITAGYKARFTPFNGGHCCWASYYDPTYSENGMNIYQWSAQFSSCASLPIKFETIEIHRQ